MTNKMHKLQILLVLLAILFLAGCATQAQVRQKEMSKMYAETVTKYNECSDEVYNNNPKLKNWGALLISGLNDPMAVQKMSIDRYLTEQEKTEFLELREKYIPCDILRLEGLSKVHPDLVSFYTKWKIKLDKEALALIKDELTIGEANTVRLDWILEKKIERTQIIEEIDREVAQSHNAELANRQRASAALQEWVYQQQLLLQNQQLINANRRPTVMNCRYFGSGLRCVGQ